MTSSGDDFVVEEVSWDDMALFKEEGGIAEFWLNRQKYHTYLSIISLRILGTQASSASLGSEFSLWKILNSPLGNRTDDETAGYIAFRKAHCVLHDPKYLLSLIVLVVFYVYT